MPTLRLALTQLNVTVGDLEGNRCLIEEAIRRAQAWFADLVVVPELSLVGYPPEDLLLKPRFVEQNLAMLGRLAPFARGLVTLVGFVDRDRAGRLYNAAAVLAHGRHVATYRKRYLPNYGVFDEKRYFTPGTENLLLNVGGVGIGVTICEDLWEVQPTKELAAAGAQLVVNLSASPYHAGKGRARERLFAERARYQHVAVAYCNLVGGQDELVFDGASLVLDARGRLLMHGQQFSGDVVVVDLAADHLGRAGRLRRGAIPIPQRVTKRPALPSVPRTILGQVEEVYEALVLGLRDYVRKNQFSTVVLGISGGVDSALTACLAVDALGPSQVRGVVMPSQYSSTQTQADAREVGKLLGIEMLEIAIHPIVETFLTTLMPMFGDRPADVTEQNLQARIRGTLLMALSNKFSWLVLTTGNKSEMATGYTTLYGDMAGGFAVIKDVPKMLVYQLARFRNQRGPGVPIPDRVFTRAPTAELAPHQTDQDTLPPYEVLDRVLKAYVEEDRGFEEILIRNHLDPLTVRKVLQMVDHAEYKRRQGPPGIKITPRAFGKDRRMPMTNRYHQYP